MPTPQKGTYTVPKVTQKFPPEHFSISREDVRVLGGEKKPIMVPAPIADFFSRLSYSVQLALILLFFFALISAPVLSAYTAYNMVIGSDVINTMRTQEVPYTEYPAPYHMQEDGVRDAG